MAWEPFPGPTPYTKDSELMNAETAAWGRAIVAVGLAANKTIASRQEVEARVGPLPSPSMPPFGPAYDKDQLGSVVGAACSQLAGNPEQGKALFMDVKRDCGDYMPAAAALAIIRCAERAKPKAPDWYPAQVVPEGRLD
jgi:hypothetical protein